MNGQMISTSSPTLQVLLSKGPAEIGAWFEAHGSSPAFDEAAGARTRRSPLSWPASEDERAQSRRLTTARC